MKYSDIENAFFFVSSATYGMNSAILNKDTGQLYYRSEMGDLNEIDDQDIDWDNCIEIPHRNDLDLGQDLVFDFVAAHMDDEYDRVRQIFSRRGAYSRFKDLLASKGLLQSWYDYENQREEQELRIWCELNGLETSD